MKNIDKWFCVGNKVAIATCFIIAGMICSLFGPTEGKYGSLEFLFYMLGLLSFNNLLFSKISKVPMNYLLFLAANSVVATIIISIVTSSYEWQTGTLVGIIVLVFFILWVSLTYMIPIKAMFKRLVISFFCAICSVLCMGVSLAIVSILRMR